MRPRKLGTVSNAHQRALVIYYALRGLQLHPIDAAWPIINADSQWLIRMTRK